MRTLSFFLLMALSNSCAISLNKEESLLDKKLKLSPGNSKQEVIDILGYPHNKQFKENIEVWQYCENFVNPKGEKRENAYLDIWFEGDYLKAINSHNGFGNIDCERNFRNIDWDNAP